MIFTPPTAGIIYVRYSALPLNAISLAACRFTMMWWSLAVCPIHQYTISFADCLLCIINAIVCCVLYPFKHRDGALLFSCVPSNIDAIVCCVLYPSMVCLLFGCVLRCIFVVVILALCLTHQLFHPMIVSGHQLYAHGRH